ncbi:MAG: ROK family protein [Planctomycetes bacterium]|nr:ROK family protein [Planctomycetota bacterium]
MTIGTLTPPGDLKTAHGVLACLESEGPLSRAAVAKKLGLSRTTLSNLISELISQGLVAELAGSDPQGRGRPGIPVDLDTSRWLALGAAYHSGRWAFTLVNLKGEVVAARTSPPTTGQPASFLSALVRGIRQFAASHSGNLLPAVGIGAPGLVNWETGTIIRAADMGWEGIDIRTAVAEGTGYAAYVLNRNRASGVAESRYGRGRNVDNFIYIGIGTGISAAIMVGGKLLHGAGYAGEIGHIVMDPDGPACGCGRRGCLQAMAAEGALVDQAARRCGTGKTSRRSGDLARLFASGRRVSGRDICRAAEDGDPVAQESVRTVAAILGLAVGNLITTFNPDKIIFGGPLIRAGAILVDYVRQETARWAMAHPFSLAAIETSSLDDYAGARGAACMVLGRKLALVAGQEE